MEDDPSQPPDTWHFDSWQPPSPTDASAAASAAAGGGGARAGVDSAILLTSCTDGVARLWRAACDPEPSHLCMFVCATLTTDPSGVDTHAMPHHAAGARSPGSARRAQHSPLQLVQWLQPTTRPSFQIAWGGGQEAYEHPEHTGSHSVYATRLSPGVRPQTSPVLSPGAGVPTLRPSLCERHDYLLAVHADGTVCCRMRGSKRLHLLPPTHLSTPFPVCAEPEEFPTHGSLHPGRQPARRIRGDSLPTAPTARPPHPWHRPTPPPPLLTARTLDYVCAGSFSYGSSSAYPRSRAARQSSSHGRLCRVSCRPSPPSSLPAPFVTSRRSLRHLPTARTTAWGRCSALRTSCRPLCR